MQQAGNDMQVRPARGNLKEGEEGAHHGVACYFQLATST